MSWGRLFSLGPPWNNTLRGYNSALIPSYRHGPGDEGQLLLGAKQDQEEEDGGEDPQGDGHKHHPAERCHQRVGRAGYQRPLDEPQDLERWGKKKNKAEQLRRERLRSATATKTCRR